ncbi:MAG: hypothetical protein JRM82_00235 [Nitrososphaerota archaeon]|nr:hypothetical protein [Nitrososphaerota archaeon]
MESGQPQRPIPKKVTYVCPSCGNELEVGLVNGLLPGSAQCSKCGTVYAFPTREQPNPQQQQWKPEDVENLIKLIDTLAAKYLTYKKDEAEAGHKDLRALTRYNTILTFTLSAFLAVIIGLMSYLTVRGSVSGDALLFLVGTVTGYILLFIQRLTKNALTEREQEEED